jgi:prevent-host-death family protein
LNLGSSGFRAIQRFFKSNPEAHESVNASLLGWIVQERGVRGETNADARDELTALWLCRTVHFTDEELSMKQLTLTQARAKLGKLLVEVEKRKRPIAITQGSKIKAVLVSAEWYSRVTEESAHYWRATKQSPLELRGSMTLIGDINQALQEIRKEREKSLEGVVARIK